MALRTLYSDDFERADASNLGAGWSTIAGTFSVVSGMAVPGSVSSAVQRTSDTVDISECWAHIEIGQTDGAGNDVLVLIVDASLNGYGVGWSGSNSDWYVDRYVGGSGTDIAANYDAPGPGVGDIIRLERRDGGVYLYVNDTLLASAADTTYNSGSAYPAIFAAWASPNRYRIESWAAGDFAAGGSSILRQMLAHHGG